MAKSRTNPTRPSQTLSADELRRIDAYWRACNYLAVGMIYLQDNPLLREPLKPEHIKNRLLGHWGASPGARCTNEENYAFQKLIRAGIGTNNVDHCARL